MTQSKPSSRVQWIFGVHVPALSESCRCCAPLRLEKRVKRKTSEKWRRVLRHSKACEPKWVRKCIRSVLFETHLSPAVWKVLDIVLCRQRFTGVRFPSGELFLANDVSSLSGHLPTLLHQSWSVKPSFQLQIFIFVGNLNKLMPDLESKMFTLKLQLFA